ncbi:DNA ligase (ATP), partial [Nowakowskiella sp. JEL0078]
MPMLADRVNSVDEIIKNMNNEEFYMQTKVDGERIVMHKQGDNYKWFSRKQTDYTKDYGADQHDGCLTPYIHELFNPRVKNVILDGEMLWYDAELQEFGKFGNLKTAVKEAKEEGRNSRKRPVYCVFDILYLNDKQIAASKLSDRIGLLPRVFTEKKTYLELLPVTPGRTATDIIDCLDSHMMRQEEGLVIKNPNSEYVAAERGKSWLKLKPDYFHNLSDDLDVLLIGACMGEGRRGGKFASFMLSVIDDRPSAAPGSVCTFAKVGSGFSMEEIPSIAKDESLWLPYEPKRCPGWLIHPPNSKEKPDMVINPSDSHVITVKGAEIVKSEAYGCNFTIRFPRFVSLRTDKNWNEALTLTQLLEYISKNKGRMQSRSLKDEDYNSKKRKKKQGTLGGGPARKVATVDPIYLATDVSKIKKSDELLKNLEFCVLPAVDDEYDKEDLEKEITKHGGKFTQHPTIRTRAVIADRQTMKVSNIIKAGNVDIVKAKWIYSCISIGDMIPLNP